MMWLRLALWFLLAQQGAIALQTTNSVPIFLEHSSGSGDDGGSDVASFSMDPHGWHLPSMSHQHEPHPDVHPIPKVDPNGTLEGLDIVFHFIATEREHLGVDPMDPSNLCNVERMNIWYGGFTQLYNTAMLEERTQEQYDQMIHKLLEFLVQRPCHIDPGAFIDLLVQGVPLKLQALVAMSSYGTTDGYVTRALRQSPDQVHALMLLHTWYNSIPINYKFYYDQINSTSHRMFVVLWFLGLVQGLNLHNYFDKLLHSNAIKWLEASPYVLDLDKLHQGFIPILLMFMPPEAYFATSYIDERLDGLVKSKVNQILGSSGWNGCGAQSKPSDWLDPPEVRGSPLRVGVMSGFWHTGTSVFRNFQPLVASLVGHYRLTFVNPCTMAHLGVGIDECSADGMEIFDKVVHVKGANGELEIKQGNLDMLCELDVLLFVDVGMTLTTTLLANLRFATVQLVTYGHSVSTKGATHADFWLAGGDVEILEDAETNYSEGVISIDGSGVYQSARAERGNPRILQSPLDESGRRVFPTPTNANPINVMLMWTAPKISALGFETLMEICQRTMHLPVVFTAFLSLPESVTKSPELRKWVTRLEVLLALNQVPANRFTFKFLQPVADFVQNVRDSDLIVDGIPYGGCTSVFDSLWAGVPIVQLEGRLWHNRVGPYYTKQILGDELSRYLVATTAEEFVDKAVAMIQSPELRFRISDALTKVPEEVFHAPGERTRVRYPRAIRVAWDTKVQMIKEEMARET